MGYNAPDHALLQDGYSDEEFWPAYEEMTDKLRPWTIDFPPPKTTAKSMEPVRTTRPENIALPMIRTASSTSLVAPATG